MLFCRMPFTHESIQVAHSQIHFIHYSEFDPYSFIDYLTEEEKERFFTFSHLHRKREFVATRYLRHQLFGFEHIHYDVNGAPYIKGEGFISISHTPGAVGIAFNKYFQIGLDIETRNDRAQRVHRKFLSEEECLLMDTSDPDRMTLAWSAKECLYKIAGRKQIDFKSELLLTPNGPSSFKGGVKTQDLVSTAEIHTFVAERYVYSINESPLTDSRIF
jgi:4'-phosphopantetheinyl transferase